MRKIIFPVIFLIAVGAGFYLVSQSQEKDKFEPMGQNNQMAALSEINDVKIETLKQGTGDGAKNGDRLSVHYTGTLTNGTKFDSSVDRGTPFELVLGAGRVIQGWEIGLVGMKAGEKRKLTIPPELAYGNAATGNIPANSTLIFEVELLKINQ